MKQAMLLQTVNDGESIQRIRLHPAVEHQIQQMIQKKNRQPSRHPSFHFIESSAILYIVLYLSRTLESTISWQNGSQCINKHFKMYPKIFEIQQYGTFS